MARTGRVRRDILKDTVKDARQREAPKEAEAQPTDTSAQAARESDRQKYSVSMDSNLLDHAKNAAYWLSGPPPNGVSLTMADLFDAAIRAELERLWDEHNQGEPYPPRKEEKLRSGRKLGGR